MGIASEFVTFCLLAKYEALVAKRRLRRSDLPARFGVCRSTPVPWPLLPELMLAHLNLRRSCATHRPDRGSIYRVQPGRAYSHRAALVDPLSLWFSSSESCPQLNFWEFSPRAHTLPM